eukprot:3097572-Prorocentrum_lima.AAC.1
MTSSLVGSEMCIRDRSSTTQWKKAVSSDRILKQVWLQHMMEPGLRAVSYTHLTLPTICSV